MRLSIAFFAALQISPYIAAAKPFIIVSTRVQNVLPTHAILPRQDLLDTINSAVNDVFGDDSDSSTTLAPAATRASVVTLPPPVTASVTESSKPSKSTKSSDEDQSSSDDSQDSTSTSSDEDSTTTTSTTESTSTTQIPTSTSAPPSTTTSASSLGSSSTATPTASADSSDGNGVPAGGVAVAVIMIILILGVSAFLVFRYNSRCRAWWAAREEKLRQERSYREAIDGPGLNSSPSLRQQALAGGASRRRTMLQSFFAPATVKLSENTEIRRKPVNWGAPASPAVPKIPTTTVTEPDDEKLSLTASAAPLGQIERYSMIPVATQLPAPPPPPKPLPPPKPTSDIAPTYLPVPTSGSFVAELPACVPITTPPLSQPNTLTRNASNSYGFGPELPTARNPPSGTPKTPTAKSHPITTPVSPMSLHPQVTSPNLGPVSPISTFTTKSPGPDHMRSISALTTSTTGANSYGSRNDTEVPMLPPLPSIPALVHAKRGSDGVFRLV